jgi:uncharacterized protein YkvS
MRDNVQRITIRQYNMIRNIDMTGNSGIGKVADVVRFPDGLTLVRWTSNSNALGVSSLVIYNSFDDAVAVHGHNGSTVFKEVTL